MYNIRIYNILRFLDVHINNRPMSLVRGFEEGGLECVVFGKLVQLNGSI